MAQLIPIERPKTRSVFDPIDKDKASELVPLADYFPPKSLQPSAKMDPIDFGSIRQMRNLNPADPAVQALADRNEAAIKLFDNTKERFRSQGGDEAAELFDMITLSTNQMPQDFEEYEKQQVLDSDTPLTEELEDIVADLPRLGEIAVTRGGEFLKELVTTGFKYFDRAGMFTDPLDTRLDNLNADERRKVYDQRLEDLIAADKGVAEGAARNVVGIGRFLKDVGSAALDELYTLKQEHNREWLRGLRTQAYQIGTSKTGLLFSPDETDPDAVFFGEAALDPVDWATFGGGKLIKGVRGLEAVSKMNAVNRHISRNIIQGTFRSVKFGQDKVKMLGGGTKDYILTKADIPRQKIADFVEGIADRNPQKAKAINQTLSDIKNVANISTLGLGRLTTATIRDLPGNFKGFNQLKNNLISELASPSGRRRFLGRMAVEHDSKLAAVAEQFGGTPVGDVLFNAAVNTVPPAVLNSLIVAQQGGDRDDIAAAIGESTAFQLPGAFIGPRGAGRDKRQRSDAAFEKARSRRFTDKGDPRERIGALAELYNRNNFNKMPQSYKDVVGLGEELNILPKHVMYLDGNDFNAAAKSLQDPDVRNSLSVSKYDNGALYFPGQDVLLLNSDSKTTGRAAINLIGEEISHSAMKRMMQNDPSFMLRQRKVFGDPEGRSIPFQSAGTTGNGAIPDVKINESLEAFIDEYNQQAAISGAPEIKDFSRAVDEFISNEASVLFGQGSDQLFDRTATPVKSIVINTRRKLLETLGVQTGSKNRNAQIKKIQDQGLRDYARDQLSQFTKERKKLDESLDSRYQAKENIKIPKGQDVIDFSSDVIQLNPNVTSVNTVAVPLDSKQAKNKAVKTKRLGKTFKREFQDVIDSEAINDPDLIRKVQKVNGKMEVRGRKLGENARDFYLSSFNKGFREDAAGMMDAMQQSINDGNVINGTFRTRKGINQGTISNRTFLPIGWKFSGAPGNLKVIIRDMDAFDHNINTLVDNGLAGGRSRNELKQHAMQQIEQAKKTGVAPDDVTKVVVHDQFSQGAPIQDANLNDFLLEDKRLGRKGRKLKDTMRTPDFEGVMGFGVLPGRNTTMSFGWESDQFKFTPFLANPMPVSKKGLEKLRNAREAADSEGSGIGPVEPGSPQPGASGDFIQPKIQDKAGFEKGQGLDARNSQIEDKAFNRILKDEDGILARHQAEFKKTVNTDDFRKHFTDDGYSGDNAASVQEPASYLAKRYWTKQLQNPQENVVFTAGGSGSGKTSAIKADPKLQAVVDDAAAVMDSNMSGLKSSLKKIKQAQEAGKNVTVYYVYRDPIDSFENGVVHRMFTNKEEAGRLVPTSVTAENHIGSYQTALELDNLKDDLGIDVVFIDNSLGFQNSKQTTRQALEKKVRFPRVQNLKAQMDAVAERIHKRGKDIKGKQYKMTDEQLKGLTQD